MSLRVDDIRPCMDGVIPGVVATCAPDGTPNVSFFSQVEYVGAEHVALSFQFFNKTRENILQNPFAFVSVPHPQTGANYCLSLEYLRTEMEGPLFERMKAKLAGIASHEGMSEVFRLRGADVYRVLDIDVPPGNYPAPPQATRNLLGAARQYVEHVARCTDVHELLEATLEDLDALFGIQRAMILMLDPAGDRLYTVASRGYASSGAGSEVPFGRGVIGVAVRERCPIRISFTAPEYSYGRAVRDSLAQGELAPQLETSIRFPGLENAQSQIAVPILAPQRVLGALYADSDEQMRFTYEDEDALMVLAAQFGTAWVTLSATAGEAERTAPPPAAAAAKSADACVVRRFADNDSIFLGDTYLIKGVAGAIFWRLVNEYLQSGRTEFSNRELRLDPRLRFPDFHDNLEARLILLQRRLADRKAPVQLAKTGRGRFCVNVEASLELQDMAGRARR